MDFTVERRHQNKSTSLSPVFRLAESIAGNTKTIYSHKQNWPPHPPVVCPVQMFDFVFDSANLEIHTQSSFFVQV